MKKTLTRMISVAVTLAMVISLLAVPVSAFSWDNVSETRYASRYSTSDYATGKFYDNLTSIPLTGDGARDVVAVAASQVGYIEGDNANGYDGETGGSTNYTEYGYYMGLTGGSSHAWCAAFCSWCFYAAEVTDVDGYYYDTGSGNIWADTYVPAWSSYLIDQGRYKAAYQFRNSYSYLYDASYVPQPGDLVFFYTASGDYPGWEGHIGLVAYSDGTYVYTLEGNTSSQDGVESEGGGAFFKKYSLTSSSLVGFGDMPYETVSGLPEIDYTGANPTPGLYVTTSGAKSVYQNIDDSTASWTLPMSSVFEVLEIANDSDGNVMLYSKCEINGSTVYGWIAHGSDNNGYTKTLQIYASTELEIPESYGPSQDGEGNYSFENAYGYVFEIDDVDGTIEGGDVTLITTASAYESCNPNWAISVQLRPVGNGEYEVVKVVSTPGSAAAAGITMEDGDVILVVHSAGSKPGYANWMDKIAAVALKEGDIIEIATDNKTATVIAPAEVVIPTMNFTGVSLAFEDEIFYNLYFTADDLSSVVEMGLVTFNEKLSDGTIENAVEVIPGYEVVGSEYCVHTNGIPAKEMGDWLYFRVYAKLTDGTYAYTTTYGYRATAYANTVLSGNSDTKTKALMVAMLNYGAAAQEYFGHNTDSLMNAGLTEEQKALVEPYRSDMIGAIVSADSSKTAAFPKDSTCYTPSISVSFEGAFAVNYYFTPKHTPDGELTMYYWDAATYNSVDAMTRENATSVMTLEKQSDGSYLGAVEGIAAKEVDSTIYVALVYTSGGTEYCSGILAYSLGTYCKSVAGGTSTAQPLGAAVAAYSYYAKEYFAIVSDPEVSDPEVSEPEVSEPEVSEPEVSEPEVSEPEVSEPEVSEPEVSEPEVSEPEVTEPEVSEPEVSEPEIGTVPAYGNLTYANGWDWSDSLCYQNQIFVFASTSSSATPITILGQNEGFLQWHNGIVFEYNEENGAWKVIVADFEADGVNEAESTTLGSNRFAVIFHDEAVVGQEDSVNFFKTYATVGAEFGLNCGVSTLQSASGAISGVTLSYPAYGNLTYANGWDWSDSLCYQNQIFVFASTSSSATPITILGQYEGFLQWQNGIVFEYNEENGAWKVIVADFEADGVNEAESTTLGSNRFAVIFHDEAVVGQEDSVNFFKTYATVGAEFGLNCGVSTLQSASGAISGVTLSYPYVEGETPSEPEEDETTVDTPVGTIQSTIGVYTSQSYPSASSGDTDGLSAVLYAPQNSTVGISTYVNLASINTSLYTSSDALAKQNSGSGIASDKNIDNAYLYLCLNSTNWSGDFGLIKRLGDEDWEIVTSEYKDSAWRWNAYAHSSDVTVTYNSNYIYTKWNVMDGLNAYYIKNCDSVTDLQMNLMYNNGTLTYSLCIGGVTIFSVSDTGSISNGKYGRAASITNSSTTSYGSSNYLYQLSGTLNGRTPAALTNVQFYDSYYYTTSGYNKLTLSTGSLWLYPCASSSAGYLVNTEGDPIVTFEEVTLTSGVVMDIIDIQNY